MNRTLNILSVAYPLARVGPDAVGGAEQILWQLDAALAHAGHRSIVVAAQGSRVQGELVSTPNFACELTDEVRHRAWDDHRRAITNILRERPVDLIHLHGLDFLHYLPPEGPPVLATLHLPPSWYPPEIFHLKRACTWLVCVSHTQRRSCPASERLLPEIINGVDVHRLRGRHARRGYALALGRICPEKGFHLAQEAAARAGMPLLLAGEVFHYPEHERYYREEVAPRLGRQSRFLGPVDFARKRRLLSAANCLLVPSLAPETSSLVAMEALACGTPVVGFKSGALPEIIEHGKTGFLVDNAKEMAAAINETWRLSAEDCRQAARTRFSLDRMAQEYFDLYRDLIMRGKDGHSFGD